MPENYANRYQTTLAAGVTSGALTGTVSTATGAPVVPFRAIISAEGANADEIVLVTGRSGTTLTWTRAAEAVAGVQAASAHGNGATFTAIVTAAQLARMDFGTYDVTRYGAVGDGVADDTAAVTAAIAAMTSGGTLFFPRGTYKTSGGFTISQPTTIRGEGQGGVSTAAAGVVSRVTCTSTTAVLFTFTGAYGRVQDIGLDYAGATAATAGGAILANGSGTWAAVDVVNVSTTGRWWVPLDMQVGSAWQIFGTMVYGAEKYCVRINNVPNPDQGDWQILHSHFYNEGAGADAAIRIQGGGGGFIAQTRVNGLVDSFTRGIDVKIATGITSGELFVTNTAIVGCGEDALHAEFTSDGDIWRKVSITDCFFGNFDSTNTTGRAISMIGRELAAFDVVTIIGNTFDDGASAGDRAAVYFSDVQHALVASNLANGGWTSVLETGPRTTDIVDASGSVGNEVALLGVPVSGDIAIAQGTNLATWLTPSWLARAAYYDTIRRTPDLRGYWRLGEPSGTDCATSGPFAITGTYVNTPTLAQTGALTGDANTAVLFTAASDEYVSLGTDADLDMTTAVTVEAWFKGTTAGTIFGRVHSVGAPGGGDDTGYRFGVVAGGAVNLVVGDDTGLISVQAGTTVLDGNYHHLVGTRSGDHMRLYIDGVIVYDNTGVAAQIGSMSASRVANIAAWPFYGTFDLRENLLTGTLDEVAVYARALDPIEVLMHYQIGVAT